MLEDVPGYIAGVTNPRFEDLPHTWDVLCNLDSGKITVSKALTSDSGDRESTTNGIGSGSIGGGGKSSSMTTGGEANSLGGHDGESAAGQHSSGSTGNNKDTFDNLFMDDVMAAIHAHYGEPAIRARFTEYISRLVRMAARYEEEFYGSTDIGFPSVSYNASSGSSPSLGSGFLFPDDTTKSREWAVNANRIEGWRRTRSYRYWKEDFREWARSPFAVPGIDVQHLLSR